MLQEIHIQNYAVIESLTVEFYPGFNVLTGETGSGKSILVDALDLALGGRASPDVIRTGADRATVTALFRAEGSGRRGARVPWRNWLEHYGVRGEAEAEIILRREIHVGGRSRLLVNDEPVTLGAAKELTPLLVEIHGQGEHALLLLREAQLDLLDAFARNPDRLDEVAGLYAQRRELEREWAGLNQSEQDRLRALDLLRFQVQELTAARIEPGEDERLEAERAVLRNLEKVRTAVTSAYTALYDDEGSALARLDAAEHALDQLGRYERSFEPHRESLAAARVALDDLARALGDYLGRLEADPARLEEIEDRLALFDRLKRKYGGSVREMLAFAESARDDLARMEHADERRAEVSRQLEAADARYRKAAESLSRERREAASQLAKDVQRELTQLGMDKARFEVTFEETESSPASDGTLALTARSGPAAAVAGGPKGIDRVLLLVSPNPGEDLRPLDRVASGGEISRLMLALKTVIAGAASRESDGAPRTLVFDEVDAGIGGHVAECVGDRLRRLAGKNQVLSVTHLPQIACFADHHFFVEKLQRGGRTFAEVQHLEAERERAAELARMLSGRQITAAVLEHAAAMLKQGSRR
ncbi:MAG TPA: DNA repair protein RecN [Terriglobia bacterium]|nr:DNA repair protein RecN [Terriglobia bacterium]